MKIRRANEADNEAICQLMESVSMGKSIELIFERRPDYFLGAAIQAEDVEAYVLVDGDIVAGVFSVGRRRVFFNGQSQNVRYLCDLRLHENYRSGLQLARGYHFIHDHILSEGEMMQTLILKDNQHAVKTLTSGRAGLPTYHPCGEYLTYFIPKQILTEKDNGVTVRAATPNDIPSMSECYQKNAKQKQFAPVIDFEEIGSGSHYSDLTLGDFIIAERAGEIVGLCALWDQSGIRRIRVKSYRSSILRWGRRVINLLSKIPLPPSGGAIPSVYLYAFTFDEVSVGTQLLFSVFERMAKGQLLVAGMDRADPMNRVWEGVSKRMNEGLHYLVAYNEITPPEGVFTFEVARI